MKRKVICDLVIMLLTVWGILILGISALYYKDKSDVLEDKVEFYEQVIDDLGINEYVNYPDVYYEADNINYHCQGR